MIDAAYLFRFAPSAHAAARLLHKLVANEHGCWVWTGATAHGYGIMNVEGASRGAHRWAWKWFTGIDPEDLFVCHHCDNPPCCNPAHLFLGTFEDNMRDAAAKGRVPARRSWEMPAATREMINAYLALPAERRNAILHGAPR